MVDLLHLPRLIRQLTQASINAIRKRSATGFMHSPESQHDLRKDKVTVVVKITNPAGSSGADANYNIKVGDTGCGSQLQAKDIADRLEGLRFQTESAVEPDIYTLVSSDDVSNFIFEARVGCQSPPTPPIVLSSKRIPKRFAFSGTSIELDISAPGVGQATFQALHQYTSSLSQTVPPSRAVQMKLNHLSVCLSRASPHFLHAMSVLMSNLQALHQVNIDIPVNFKLLFEGPLECPRPSVPQRPEISHLHRRFCITWVSPVPTLPRPLIDYIEQPIITTHTDKKINLISTSQDPNTHPSESLSIFAKGIIGTLLTQSPLSPPPSKPRSLSSLPSSLSPQKPVNALAVYVAEENICVPSSSTPSMIMPSPSLIASDDTKAISKRSSAQCVARVYGANSDTAAPGSTKQHIGHRHQRQQLDLEIACFVNHHPVYISPDSALEATIKNLVFGCGEMSFESGDSKDDPGYSNTTSSGTGINYQGLMKKEWIKLDLDPEHLVPAPQSAPSSQWSRHWLKYTVQPLHRTHSGGKGNALQQSQSYLPSFSSSQGLSPPSSSLNNTSTLLHDQAADQHRKIPHVPLLEDQSDLREGTPSARPFLTRPPESSDLYSLLYQSQSMSQSMSQSTIAYDAPYSQSPSQSQLFLAEHSTSSQSHTQSQPKSPNASRASVIEPRSMMERGGMGSMHHTDKHTRGPTEANAMGDGDDDDDDDENKNTASQVLRLYLRFSLPDHFNPTAQVTADTLSEMIGASKGAQEAVCRCLTAVLLQMQARLSRKPKNLSPAELREKRMRENIPCIADSITRIIEASQNQSFVLQVKDVLQVETTKEANEKLRFFLESLLL